MDRESSFIIKLGLDSDKVVKGLKQLETSLGGLNKEAQNNSKETKKVNTEIVNSYKEMTKDIMNYYKTSTNSVSDSNKKITQSNKDLSDSTKKIQSDVEKELKELSNNFNQSVDSHSKSSKKHESLNNQEINSTKKMREEYTKAQKGMRDELSKGVEEHTKSSNKHESLNNKEINSNNKLGDNAKDVADEIKRANSNKGDIHKKEVQKHKEAVNEHENLNNKEVQDTKETNDKILAEERTFQSKLKALRDRMATSPTVSKVKEVASRPEVIAGGTAVSLAGVGFGKKAITDAMEFGDQMSKLKAVSGATEEEFKKLKAQALELGASTSKSASEVANGMLEMSTKGYDVNKIMDAMPGIISASEASGEDMALTADVMASAMNGFGMEADQANHVADVLAMTANESAAGILDMQYALKYSATPAKNLGVSMEELSASIGMMVDAGLTGETAGTTLRGAMLGLLSPSEKNSKLMKKMGVEVTDAQGNFVGLAQLVRNLDKSMEGMTETQKAANLAQLVGKEAVSGMLTLMGQGPEKIEAMTKKLEESDGASAKTAKVMKDNFKGAVDEFGGAIETIGIKVGDDLTPTIQAATKLLTSLASGFSSLPDGVRQTTVVIGAVATLLTPTVLAIGMISKSTKTAISGIKKMSEVMKLNTLVAKENAIANTSSANSMGGGVSAKGGKLSKLGAFARGQGKAGKVAGVVGGLATAGLGIAGMEGIISPIFGVLATALGAVSAPILAVVAGIGLLTAGLIYLYKNNEHVKKFFDNIGKWFKELPGNVMKWFGNTTKNLSSYFKGVGDTYNKGVEKLKGIFKTIGDTIQGLINKVGSFFGMGGGQKNKKTDNKQGSKGGGEKIELDFPKLGFATMLPMITSMIISNIKNSFRKGFTSAIGEVRKLFPQFFELGNKLKGLFTSVVNVIKKLGTTVSLIGQAIKKVIVEALSYVASKISSVFKTVSTPIVNSFNFLKGKINDAKSVALVVLSVVSSKVSSVFKSITSPIVNAFNVLSDKISQISKFVTDRFNNTVNTAKGGISSVLNVIQSVIQNVTQKIGGFIGTIIQKVGQIMNSLRKIADPVVSEVSRVVSNITGKFNEIYNSVVRVAGNITNKIVDIVNGFFRVFNDLVGRVTGIFDDIGSKIDGFNRKLSSFVNSPSRHSRGTRGHQGGDMIVGDFGAGNGSSKRELVIFPNGNMFLSPNRETLIPNAPAGTQVLNGRETEELLKPKRYASGTGGLTVTPIFAGISEVLARGLEQAVEVIREKTTVNNNNTTINNERNNNKLEKLIEESLSKQEGLINLLITLFSEGINIDIKDKKMSHKDIEILLTEISKYQKRRA